MSSMRFYYAQDIFLHIVINVKFTTVESHKINHKLLISNTYICKSQVTPNHLVFVTG